MNLIFFFFKGIYVTEVQENSPAAKAGLRVNDKILHVCKCLLFTFHWIISKYLLPVNYVSNISESSTNNIEHVQLEINQIK